MARTAATPTVADRASAVLDEREPEIMRSGHLANILTLSLVEMIEEATKRYESAGLGRRMAPELAAMRGTVDEVRRWHRLVAIDWRTGELVESDNGAGTVSPALVEAVAEAEAKS